MPRFIRSVLAQDEAVTVSTVVTYDLPVNPLSHLLFTLKYLNDTGTITNYNLIAAALASVSQVEILFKGQAIISGSLTDLMFLNWLLTGWQPNQGNAIKTNNDAREITVPISLSRVPFLPAEAFPASRRGELQLRVTYAAAQTGIDNLIAQIETVELLDVQPSRFLKYTTLSQTFAATGDVDQDMPIGNDILGILLFGTTVPDGAVYTSTINTIKMLLDNVEFGYSQANWETLHGELLNRAGSLYWTDHIHRNNQATAGTESDTGIQQINDTIIENYAYLDYDPLKDTSYALETAGHSRVHARVNAGAADAARFLPVELILVGADGVPPVVPAI